MQPLPAYNQVCNQPHNQEVWHSRGFPSGTVVKNPPANAGDTGLSPGPGRSHMPQSNEARAPQLLSLRVWSLCTATRESLRAATEV